ncbi:hypothetical protein DYB32_003462 [Aphanomyces invadans]|uniref:Mitochondrial carrier protein n=1 Tax=Aphanomyces invadans TaxID=157072 RepID=A0A418B0M0_9STRA|nr:hypothetical protein DYB32_003462 [Aphanomyces invadans]
MEERSDKPVEALPPGLEKRIAWDDLDKTKYYIVGPSVMVFVRAAVYPSNLVKTRLQIQSRRHPLYTGTFDAFRKIVRQEGFLGLYKGFGASLLNIVIGNLYITVYEIVNQFAMQNLTVQPSVRSSTLHRLHLMYKVGVQAASKAKTLGLLSISRDIFRKQGILGFYKGYIPSVLTYAPSSGIWWGFYGAVWPVFYANIPFDMEPMPKQSTSFSMQTPLTHNSR